MFNAVWWERLGECKDKLHASAQKGLDGEERIGKGESKLSDKLSCQTAGEELKMWQKGFYMNSEPLGFKLLISLAQ